MKTSILIIAGTKITNLPVNLPASYVSILLQTKSQPQNKITSEKCSNNYSITPLLFDEKKQAQPNLKKHHMGVSKKRGTPPL